MIASDPKQARVLHSLVKLGEGAEYASCVASLFEGQ